MKNKNRKEDHRSMIMKILNDVKAAWAFVIFSCSGSLGVAAWASEAYHSKFLTVEAYYVDQFERGGERLHDELADLNIELDHTIQPQERLRIKALIIRRETKLKTLKVKK